MSRLRVVHLGKFYPPARGGMETILETLCRGERHDVETRALVVNRGRDTQHDVVDGVPVTRVGRAVTIGAVAVAPTLPLWLARARADVIVLHEPNPMALLAYFLARPPAPLIVWYHSDAVRPPRLYRLFYQPLLTFALRRAARIVAASPPMRDVPALAAHRERCVVIPYGLEPERYRPAAVVAEQAAALRAQRTRPLLLFVGRLVPYKGIDVLLRALPGLDADLVIVGDGRDRPSVQSTIAELGLGDRVRLTGDVSDETRLAWLHASDVLVLPSTTRQEAFGLAQLEAMLCGRPVVSTDLPTGVPWVNVHGQTGLVVPPGDVVALRDALAHLLADGELRTALGRAAYARARAVFAADRMCAAAMALYREVAGT